jgi:hypothetical protein
MTLRAEFASAANVNVVESALPGSAICEVGTPRVAGACERLTSGDDMAKSNFGDSEA